MTAKLVVVSGGPGAGKTTLLQEVERRGFCYAPEVARQIIQEQVLAGGDALPWADQERYSRLMLERSISIYRQYTDKNSLVFFDRGIPDTLCYVRLTGIQLEDELLKACRTYRYSEKVFLAPPWREIYLGDSERKQTFEEAVRTYDLMAQTYEDCGYNVVELPRMSVGERAEFLLNVTSEL